MTILLKPLFYKLTETSGRSMAKMRTIAPRIKNIQERYKDDRDQLAKHMMELYKREKINPVAGCLPIVVQIPVFLAFYWVLLESVEMRQAPFMGWIQDLSSKDPFFILPILMGVAMFGQFKLNPAPPDPMQAKIFAFMPVVMTVMMAWFPAGLVLYWLTNTLLSIAQQWNINRWSSWKPRSTRIAPPTSATGGAEGRQGIRRDEHPRVGSGNGPTLFVGWRRARSRRRLRRCCIYDKSAYNVPMQHRRVAPIQAPRPAPNPPTSGPARAHAGARSAPARTSDSPRPTLARSSAVTARH